MLCSTIDIHIYECTVQVLVLDRLHYARLHYSQVNCHSIETFASWTHSASDFFPVVLLCGDQDLNLLFSKSLYKKPYHKYIDFFDFYSWIDFARSLFHWTSAVVVTFPLQQTSGFFTVYRVSAGARCKENNVTSPKASFSCSLVLSLFSFFLFFFFSWAPDLFAYQIAGRQCGIQIQWHSAASLWIQYEVGPLQILTEAGFCFN